MKKYILLLPAFAMIFCGGCSSTPAQKEMKGKKILDFDNYRDEEARRGYDVLRVQVGDEQILYRPVNNAPAENRIVIKPNLGKTPVYTVNEEHTSVFAFDSDEISPAFKEDLAEIARQIQTFENVRVRVEGYTDSIGTAEYNFDLSTRRAKAVAYFLTANGVNAGIITFIGHGKNAPVASNSTEAGRAQNRRVELFVFTPED